MVHVIKIINLCHNYNLVEIFVKVSVETIKKFMFSMLYVHFSNLMEARDQMENGKSSRARLVEFKTKLFKSSSAVLRAVL